MNSPIRLWHDDVRKAPEGWLWCRTNEAAILVLTAYGDRVVEISLDHDMGLHEVDVEANPEAIFLAGPNQDEESGMELVKWMCESGLVPPKITIHSWNHDRALAMAHWFNDHGHTVTVKPFEVRG